jgi:hypothetical protein
MDGNGRRERIGCSWRSAGGLITAEAWVAGGFLKSVRITGDFFIFPPDTVHIIEGVLADMPLDREALVEAVASVLNEGGVETVGIGPVDIVNAILGPCVDGSL